MKIGLIIEHIDPRRGGAETSTNQFINHLLARGVEVEVFTRSQVDFPPGYTVHTIDTRGALRVQATAAYLRNTMRAVRTAGLNVVHALTPLLSADIYEPRGGTLAETIQRNIAMRKTAPARLAKSLLLRLNRRQQLLLRQERQMLERDPPPTVVALSQYVARQLDEHYSLNSRYVEVIFNGVDPDGASPRQREEDRAEIRRALGLADDQLAVLTVAHNFRLKGLTESIDAIAELRRRHAVRAVLLVVGRDSPARYQRQAQRLGIASNVRFVPPTERIFAFYHAADVLLHPTYYDPCSRVVLEALSAGLPCITTRFNGACEIMEDGRHGFVVDAPQDSDALVTALSRLADDDFRARAADAARGLGSRLTMRAHADQMIALYEKTLARRRNT
jgi:UDP-glucose:(heptosyl)LPS alpha-1,3-glucosyltransferase